MRLRLFPFLAVAVVSALVGLAACSNESEGEPCSLLNGNNDCNDGLVCETPPNQGATSAPAVCCPQAGQPASTPECSLSGQLDAGNPAAPDGSTFPEASVPADGSSEARAPEAGPDAATSDGSSAADATTADAGPG